MRFVPPQRTLVVASTQRSGSTYLCSLIAETGVAGNPLEFFEAMAETGRPPHPGFFLAGLARTDVGIRAEPAPTVVPEYSDVRAVEDWSAHLERTFALGTTANGVFSTKLMWNQLPEMAWYAYSVPELAGLSGLALLEALFGAPEWVRVRRQDKAAQAVSLWRALQTRAWSSDGPAPARAPEELRYSFAAIDHLRRRLEADELGWDTFFAGHGLKPLELVYEVDIAPDPHEALTRVLARVGVEQRVDLDETAPLTRQSDALNAAWRAAYERDLTSEGR